MTESSGVNSRTGLQTLNRCGFGYLRTSIEHLVDSLYVNDKRTTLITIVIIKGFSDHYSDQRPYYNVCCYGVRTLVHQKSTLIPKDPWSGAAVTWVFMKNILGPFTSI